MILKLKKKTVYELWLRDIGRLMYGWYSW